jgi:hypothetical protein
MTNRKDKEHLRQMLALLRGLVRGAGQAGAVPRTPAFIMVQALSAGLIEGRPDSPTTLTITPAGRAWLRRQLASDDPFLNQHRELRTVTLPPEPGKPATPPLTVNDAESPLAWLRQRKDRHGAPMLDDHQFAAGERLRKDYTFAALGPRVTANWSAMAPTDRSQRSGASAGAMRDDVIAARARVSRAIAQVGPELGRILIDVCCLLKGIEAAEHGMGLPQRSGKVVLQLALTALARHYGLIAPPAPRNEVQHILQWGVADYRPAM